MFDGYLSFGGNEIINSPRAWALSQVAECSTSWFKKPDCETLADALLEPEYDVSGYSTAPWFDPAHPDLSERFFGLYGLDLQQVDDVDREVQITEGVRDGAVVGRTRLPAKRIRARAFALADGEDAMSHGLAWLRGALAPGACGQHGDRCGVTDLEMFVDCPPERPDHVVGTEVNRNAVLNPAFRDIREDEVGHVFRRNLIPNPNFETGLSFWMEGNTRTEIEQVDRGSRFPWISTGTKCLRAFTNDEGGNFYVMPTPAGRPPITAGQWVGVMVSMDSDHPGMTAHVSVQGMNASGGLVSGAGFTLSQRVIEGGAIFSGSTLIEDSDVASIRPIPWVSAASYPAGSSFYLGGVVVVVGDSQSEVDAALESYFDGDTTSDGGWPLYAWEGEPHASPSIEYAPVLVNVNAWSTWDVYSSGENSAIFRPQTLDSSGTAAFTSMIPSPIPEGTLVTVRAEVRAVGGSKSVGIQVGNEFIVPVQSITESQGWVELGGSGLSGSMSTFGYRGARIYTYRGENLDSFLEVRNVQVTIGTYDGPYFDGDTPDTADYRYTWSEDPDASESISEALEYVPYDDDEYAELVREDKRYLHEVTVESGPLEVERFKSKNIVGREIEFTFVAGKAFLYGPTVQKQLPSSATTIVEDILYNLVKTPRPGHLPTEALTGNIAAVNYMSNPSAETNLTGITWDDAAITGTRPSSNSRITHDRSMDLAVAGRYSSLLRLTGATSIPNPRSKARMWVTQTSASIPAGMRMVASVWAAGIIAAAPDHSSVNEIKATFTSIIGGSSEVFDVVTISDPDEINGFVFESTPKVMSAAGTIRIEVEAEVEWTSGTVAANNSDIRLYTDAFIVTDG